MIYYRLDKKSQVVYLMTCVDTIRHVCICKIFSFILVCTGVWVEVERYSPLPSHAVCVGRDSDGQSLYAGRAYHEDDLLPAKVNPTHTKAYVCWGGLEHAKAQYEV